MLPLLVTMPYPVHLTTIMCDHFNLVQGSCRSTCVEVPLGGTHVWCLLHALEAACDRVMESGDQS